MGGRTIALAAIAMLGVGAAGYHLYMPHGSGDARADGAIAACEEVTKDGLNNPGSFNAVWSDFTLREPMSDEEIVADMRTRVCKGDSPGERFVCGMVRKEWTAARIHNLRLLANPSTAAQAKSGDKASPELIANLQSSFADPTGFVLLEHDSENAFGASMRGFAICRFGPLGGDPKTYRDAIVRHGPVAREEGEKAKAEYRALSSK